MGRYVGSGIQKKEDRFVFDYDHDELEDVIHLLPPTLSSSKIRGCVYWFGYEFNASASSSMRSEFIKEMKGLGNGLVSNKDLKRFIEDPLELLDKHKNLNDFDFFVYPLSERSQLVTDIIRTIGTWVSRNIENVSFELIKSAPHDVIFDWDSFQRDIDGIDAFNHKRYLQMSEYVEDTLIPKMNSGTYFSLAESVKAKYRPYVTSFLVPRDAEKAERLMSMESGNALIVDDVNTSGSTINEILRIVNSINNSLNVYVYTLLGRR